MTQELYIEGNKVDMFDDVVSLQYRSNLFGDLASITSSNSLTIRLPKTPRNNKVLGFSDVPYSTSFERRWYNVSYLRNGIPILNGKLKLLSTTVTEYEVCIMWGIIKWIQDVVESEETLRNLPFFGNSLLRIVDESLYSTEKGILFGYYYYKNGSMYAFPVVSVKWIFVVIIGYLFGNDNITLFVDVSDLDDYYINFNEDLIKELNVDLSVRPPQEPSFSIKDYIPNIKIIDFFKAICQMMGWYVEVLPNGKLGLIEMSIIFNDENVIDWSEKLISGDIPDSISFDYKDYAQRNFMRYKEDDTVDFSADGYISVSDATISKDKTLFTLPFAPTYKGEIKQYVQYLNDEGELEMEFTETQPRIMKVVELPYRDYYGVEFTEDMYFQRIISERYSELQTIIEKPIMVTARFKLNEFDLLSLNFMRLVYVEQYGSVFAIIEVQNQGEESVVKLLKV